MWKKLVLFYVACVAIIFITGASSNAQTLLNMDFNNGEADGWEFEGGDWKVEDGALNQLSIAAEAGIAWYSEGMDWTDYTIESKLKVLEGAAFGAGILFRYNDPATLYMARIHGNGLVQLYKFSSGAKTNIAEVPFIAELGSWYTLKAEITDSGNKAHIAVYVLEEDDQPLIEIDDEDPIESGTVGFRDWANSSSHDYILVYGPQGMVVNPRAKLVSTWAYIKTYYIVK